MEDFNKGVGMMSRLQVALEEVRMACITSVGDAGVNESSVGGRMGGAMCGSVHSVKTEESRAILPSKNRRKEETSWDNGVPVGRIFGDFCESKELSVDQSWRG